MFFFCNSTDETLEHLFFSCPVSRQFWSNVMSWVSLKLNIPSLCFTHILLYMDNLSPFTCNIINIVLILAKYHIHCSKLKGNQPSFSCFINAFKACYSALHKIKDWNFAKTITQQISKSLLF